MSRYVAESMADYDLLDFQQVRFALSSSGSWCSADGAYSLKDFYDEIIEAFRVCDDAWRAETIAFWDE